MMLLLFTFINVYWSNFRERVKGKTEVLKEETSNAERSCKLKFGSIYKTDFRAFKRDFCKNFQGETKEKLQK